MKQEQWFKYFFVTFNNGKVVKVDACPGADIYYCVRDIVIFLRKHKIDDEFVLRFNDKKLRISRLSSPNDVVNEYFGKNEQGL